MKTAIKSIALVLTLVFTLGIVAGCGLSMSPSDYAKEVVTQTYDGYKTGTLEGMGVDSAPSTVPEEALSALKRIEYTIVSTKEISDTEVEVTVKTKALDIKTIMSNYLNEAMSLATQTELTEEEITTKAKEILVKCFTDESIDLVEVEKTLTVVCEDDTWKIKDTAVLSETVLAGYSEVVESLGAEQ